MIKLHSESPLFCFSGFAGYDPRGYPGMDPLPLRTSSQHTGGKLTETITTSHSYLVLKMVRVGTGLAHLWDHVRIIVVTRNRGQLNRSDVWRDGETYCLVVWGGGGGELRIGVSGFTYYFRENSSTHLDAQTCYKLKQNGNFGCTG
jgi:hypothetical protein